MTGPDPDPAIRLAAFQWLAQAVAFHGDLLPRTPLEAGFECAGRLDIHQVRGSKSGSPWEGKTHD